MIDFATIENEYLEMEECSFESIIGFYHKYQTYFDGPLPTDLYELHKFYLMIAEFGYWSGLNDQKVIATPLLNRALSIHNEYRNVIDFNAPLINPIDRIYFTRAMLCFNDEKYYCTVVNLQKVKKLKSSITENVELVFRICILKIRQRIFRIAEIFLFIIIISVFTFNWLLDDYFNFHIPLWSHLIILPLLIGVYFLGAKNNDLLKVLKTSARNINHENNSSSK